MIPHIIANRFVRLLLRNLLVVVLHKKTSPFEAIRMIASSGSFRSQQSHGTPARVRNCKRLARS